jgi:hypothetical protein
MLFVTPSVGPWSRNCESECKHTLVRHPRGRTKTSQEAFVDPEIERSHVDEELRLEVPHVRTRDVPFIRRGVEMNLFRRTRQPYSTGLSKGPQNQLELRLERTYNTQYTAYIYIEYCLHNTAYMVQVSTLRTTLDQGCAKCIAYRIYLHTYIGMHVLYILYGVLSILEQPVRLSWHIVNTVTIAVHPPQNGPPAPSMATVALLNR